MSPSQADRWSRVYRLFPAEAGKNLFRFYIPAQKDQVFQSMRQPIVGESLSGKTEVAVNCGKIVVLSSVKYTKQNF